MKKTVQNSKWISRLNSLMRECGCREGAGGHFVNTDGKTTKIPCPNCKRNVMKQFDVNKAIRHIESNYRKENEKPLKILNHTQMIAALTPMMYILKVYNSFKSKSKKCKTTREKFKLAEKLINKANLPFKKRLAEYDREDKRNAKKGILIAR